MWIVAGAVVLTLVATLLVLNMSSGEKKIQHRVERLYSIEDPQFRHVMGVLLGPMCSAVTATRCC